jgi:hypothetical protein
VCGCVYVCGCVCVCVCVCLCVSVCRVVEMSVAPTNREPAVTPVDSSNRTAPNTPTPSRDHLVIFVPYSLSSINSTHGIKLEQFTILYNKI